MNIQTAILQMQQRARLFSHGDRVLVGVSGGADSLALLHALAALRKTLHIELVAATLDHGLRGEESRTDASYVVHLAETWDVPVQARYADVSSLAIEWKIGIEEAARRARYDFLATTANSQGAHRVAVAHHADDQAETVLMHLLRGSGLDGLAGMTPASAMPGHDQITLLRPLLQVPRAGIEAYCRRYGIIPRGDATNDDTTATRNWVRHVLLPLIETRYPGAPRALTDLADNAARDVEVLNDATREWADHLVVDGLEISLERRLFRQAREAVQRRLIRWSADMLAPGTEMSHERTDAAVALFRDGHKGQKVELPGGLLATVDRDTVRLTRITR